MGSTKNPIGTEFANGSKDVHSARPTIASKMRSLVVSAIRSVSAPQHTDAISAVQGVGVAALVVPERANGARAAGDTMIKPDAIDSNPGHGGGDGGTNPPECTITAPIDGATVQAGVPFTVTGTASNYTTLEVRSGGATTIGSPDPNGLTPWSSIGLLPLNAYGQWSIEAIASSERLIKGVSSKWTTTAKVTVMVPDTTAPTVTVAPSTPGTGPDTTFSAVVTGTAADLQSGVGSVEVSLNGGSFSAATTGDGWAHWSATVTIPLGTYPVTVRATDKAGNVATTPTSVTAYDSIPPDLTIEKPANGTKISGTEKGVDVTVSGTASDTQSGLQLVEVSLDTQPYQPAMTSDGWTHWTATVHLPALAARTISVRATDKAGNQTIATVTVEVTVPYKLQDPTPLAYLSDLLDFAYNHVIVQQPDGSSIALDASTLARPFFQPFNAVLTDDPVNQTRIAIEVLRPYLGSITVPAPVRAALAKAEKDYRVQAYETLLVNLGVSYDDIRLARTADPDTRRALADRLGIDLAPVRPDQLDTRFLMRPDTITEAHLEQLFGLRDTTRDPLTSPPTPDLLAWQQAHLRTLWARQDHPAGIAPVTLAPLIDPDLLGQDDFVIPASGLSNLAHNLWQQRVSWVQEQLSALAGDLRVGETNGGRLDRLVDGALGAGTAASLVALETQREGGATIDAKLPPGLAADAFVALMRLRRLAQTATLLDEEWADIYSILVQAQKARRYPAWRLEEATLTLGPDYFVVADGMVLPPWRTTSAARRIWRDTLQARIDQQQSTTQALWTAVGAVEEVMLPALRRALIKAIEDTVTPGAVAPGAPDFDASNALTERLLIDVATNGRQQTTRLSQAIDTVQNVLSALRTGRFKGVAPQLGGDPTATWSIADPNNVFDTEWVWLGTYATWRAAMLVFLYPENMLIPTLRAGHSDEFRRLLSAVRQKTQVTPEDARGAAQNYFAAMASRHTAFKDLASKVTDLLDTKGLTALRDDVNIQGLFPTDGSPPPVELAEVFWDVPMYLALQLQQFGQYESALDWFRVVYAYNLSADGRAIKGAPAPSAGRKVYFGLVLEHTIPSRYERSLQWLVDSLNPHDLASTRADAYTRFTLFSIVRCFLDFADADFAAGTTESVSRARDLYLTALDLLRAPELQPSAAVAGIALNPVMQALRQHAQLNLRKLRDGRNIAGMERQSTAVSTADNEASARAITAGRPPASVSPPQPTPYRYTTLVERAKQLVTIAQQIEGSYLAAIVQGEAETYNIMKARQDLGIGQANVQLQDLRIGEASDGVTLAGLQQQRAQVQQDTYQQWLGAGLNQWESGMIQSYKTAGAKRNWLAEMDAAVTIAQAATTAASGGWFGTGIGAGIGGAGMVAAVALSRVGAQIDVNKAETAAQIDSANASFERRTQEWQLQKSMAQQDVAIGAQQVLIAQAHVAVARGELSVAQLQADHAQATVDFLANKFTNADLYEWMSGVLGRVYSYFLQQATAIARLAQGQLAFERQEKPLSFIQADYWQAPSDGTTGGAGAGTQTDRRGLTGSARLLEDIYQLDQYAFETNKRKLQLTKTISLARLAPLEFQRFRETGVLRFATPMDLFDRDFPGHYLRLIKQVRTSVIALIPPTQGIRATLASTGVSRVTLGDGGLYQTVVVRRDPDLVALTSPMNATGLFALDAQPDMTLFFEGMGVDTAWELQLPRATNPFDYTTIADVLISIDYTALYSTDYRQQVIGHLDRSFSADGVYSLRQQFPDQWYDLHNPDQSKTPMSVKLTTSRTDFPPNLEDLRIEQVVLAYATVNSGAGSLPGTTLTFTPTRGAVPLGSGPLSPIDGVISTRRGNASAWEAMITQYPVGAWQLSLPNDAATRALFTDGSNDAKDATEYIDDILLIITYGGVTPDWPT